MSLDELFGHLCDGKWEKDGYIWPPDAFALCAMALLKSGSYTRAVTEWPPGPGKDKNPKKWVEKIIGIGSHWRETAPKNRAPNQISTWWKILISNKHVQLHEFGLLKNNELVDILIQVSAAADEASNGIGLSERPDDLFDEALLDIFDSQRQSTGYISTLCKTINCHHVRVLPKLHTPKLGITIRSLSHNLALCPSGEVVPQYWPAPNVMDIDETMNILLVPWPRMVHASDFSAVKTGVNMAEQFGLFRYEIPEEKKSEEIFEKILKSAGKTVWDINGIIFPELALRPGVVEKFWTILKRRRIPCFLIAGTADQMGKGQLGENKAVCYVRVDKKMQIDLKLEQIKHHRWGLDETQLQQYSLTSRLSQNRHWWEASKIPARCLQFVKLSPYAVMSFLVCEDLARQDPIAETVRSVGPNLVFALLMDGPQLASRWSSRYATVLADDPGCSVLTLTSIGMARRSKCLGKPESRVVALWKDSRKGPYEIELPFDAEALVLSLRLHRDSEWSADGRHSKETAGRWELESVHPVKLD